MPLDLPAHVWVDDGAHHRRPGLLLAWRQRDGRWEGWVILGVGYVSSGQGAASVSREVQVYQSWVDAKTIAPA